MRHNHYQHPDLPVVGGQFQHKDATHQHRNCHYEYDYDRLKIQFPQFELQLFHAKNSEHENSDLPALLPRDLDSTGNFWFSHRKGQ